MFQPHAEEVAQKMKSERVKVNKREEVNATGTKATKPKVVKDASKQVPPPSRVETLDEKVSTHVAEHHLRPPVNRCAQYEMKMDISRQILGNTLKAGGVAWNHLMSIYFLTLLMAGSWLPLLVAGAL